MEGNANATPMGIPMETPIDQIGLDRRTCKVLLNAGIDTAGDLSGLNPDNLVKIRGMGKKSTTEIMERIKDMQNGGEKCKSRN